MTMSGEKVGVDGLAQFVILLAHGDADTLVEAVAVAHQVEFVAAVESAAHSVIA